MTTGTAGTTARLYHQQMIHYLRKALVFGDEGVAKTVGIVPDGALLLKPLSGVFVNVAFDDSGTDVLDIGPSTNDDLWMTDGDLSSIAFVALDEAVTMLVSGDSTVIATYTGQNNNAAAGAAVVVIAYVPNNDL